MLHYATYQNSQFSLDLATEIKLNRQQAIDFVDDMLGLDLFFLHLGHTDLKIVGPSDIVATIHKDHTLQKVKLNGNETKDIYGDLNQLWGTEYVFADYIVSLVSLINKSEIIQASIKTLILSQDKIEPTELNAEVKAKAEELAGESGIKYVDSFIEAAKLENSLHLLELREQSVGAVDEMRKELSELDKKISQARTLIRSQQELDKAMQKYSYLLNKDLDKDAQVFAGDIAQIRVDQLNESAKQDAYVRAMSGEKTLANPKRGNYLVALALVILAFGIGLSLISRNLLFGTVGILIFSGELGLWWALNQIAPTAVFNLKLSAQQSDSVQRKATIAEKVIEKLKFLEKFFVDKAWVKALRAESENVNSQVQQRLEGADYAELMTARHALLQTMASLAFSARMSPKPETPVDMIEVRRKLDLLRLERARLESDLREQDNFAALVDLTMVTESKPQPELDISDLGLAVTKLKLNEQDELLGLAGSEWTQYQPALPELVLLNWQILVRKWIANPTFPLLRLSPASVNLSTINLLEKAQLISIQVQGE